MKLKKLFSNCTFAMMGAILLLFISCGKDDNKNVPVLSTTNVTDITQATAVSGGNIIDEVGSPVTSRGVCWSTNENPTINDSKTVDGADIGSFTSNITGLTQSTSYYVRAYATNSYGTGYGQQENFTTTSGDFTGNVTDIVGNEYTTVMIGTQEWMAENLRTTKYNDNTSIPTGHSAAEYAYLTTGAYSVYTHTQIEGYDSDAEVLAGFGALYNWYAIATDKLCPTGWRTPSNEDWTDLINYVEAQGYPNSNVVGGAANALKSCRQFNSPLGGDCSTNVHPRWYASNTHFGTDVFGFSALPGGGRYPYGTYGGHTQNVTWWSSTSSSTDEARYLGMSSNNGSVENKRYLKQGGFSVRCIRGN